MGAATRAWLLLALVTTLAHVVTPARVTRQLDNISEDQFACLLLQNCPQTAPQPPPQPARQPASQQPCTCIDWWLCRDSQDDTITVVDLRSNAPLCGDNVEIICCPNHMMETQGSQPPTPSAPATPPPSCGVRNTMGVDVNFQGFVDGQAQFGEYPWMAVVMSGDVPPGTDPLYVCGGSLIHPRVVLTVAHHTFDKPASNLIVRLGEWNLIGPTEHIPHQEIRVARVIVHPQFNRRTVDNDIALLVLERDAELGRTVNTICLPRPGQRFDGARCHSSGWGKKDFRGTYQEILKSIELPVVSNALCQSALRTSPRLGPSFTLHPSFMCAGGANVDTCTGDGGSPLVCADPGNPSIYVQAGIVAWGLECGQAGMPGVYANVAHAATWIQQQLLAVAPPLDIRQGQARRG